MIEPEHIPGEPCDCNGPCVYEPRAAGMSEPRTEAGRALLAMRPDLFPPPGSRQKVIDAILAIEEEASRTALAPTVAGSVLFRWREQIRAEAALPSVEALAKALGSTLYGGVPVDLDDHYEWWETPNDLAERILAALRVQG